MNRPGFSRVDPKRRAHIDHKKRQFAKAEYAQQNYEHSLNFYSVPPTAEISLEEFETWAIQRLKGVDSYSLPSLALSIDFLGMSTVLERNWTYEGMLISGYSAF